MAYQPLKASVYQSLYLQTAGQNLIDLIDLIELKDDEYESRLDFAAVNAEFSAKAAQNPAGAVVDLAEFIYFTYSNPLGSAWASSSLRDSDWDGPDQLADLLQTTPLDAAQSAILAGFNYKFAGPIDATVDANLGGSTGADVLVGRAGNDKLETGSGNDILIGGQGDDQLIGGYGNDQMVGGQGNDYLNGQWGTDTYFWGASQGNDYIHDGLVNRGEQNTVVLRGLNPGDVSVELVTPENFSRFRLTILASGETLTLDTSGWTYGVGSTSAPVRLVFADGGQWSFEEIVRQTFRPQQ
ncbi:MAG: calcium-binding protein [Hylemonella sp.]|nr:calcium-binding protein [Hylemonella sp.]